MEQVLDGDGVEVSTSGCCMKDYCSFNLCVEEVMGLLRRVQTGRHRSKGEHHKEGTKAGLQHSLNTKDSLQGRRSYRGATGP